jgi:hypothetical protein
MILHIVMHDKQRACFVPEPRVDAVEISTCPRDVNLTSFELAVPPEMSKKGGGKGELDCRNA